MKKILLSVVIATLFVGCASVEKETDPSVRHMVKSEKLTTIMRQIDTVIYERQMSELDRDRRRGRYVLNLASTLRDLADELEHIEASDTKADDSIVYKKYAKLIDTEAAELEVLAKEHTFEFLPQRVENLKNICNSCHLHFGVEHRK